MAQSKKVDISQSGPVKQLLNEKSINLTGTMNRIVQLDRASLDFLEENRDIYPVFSDNEAEMDAIARDIAESGIQQPLIVYPTENNRYVVISGNRRLAAVDLAREKYDYKPEFIPCLIQSPPKNQDELMMRVIKNNLQRTKVRWVRMMEIVTYSNAVAGMLQAEGRKGVREIVKRDLAATDAEITRYLKIYNNLIPELLEYYKEGDENTTYLTTNAAFEIAGYPREEQQVVLDLWDKRTSLTIPIARELLVKHERMEQERLAAEAAAQGTSPDGEENPDDSQENPTEESGADRDPFQPENLTEGLKQLQDLCSDLSDVKLPESTSKGAARTEQKLLRKLGKELARVAALKEALNRHIQKYGPKAEEEPDDGPAPGPEEETGT